MFTDPTRNRPVPETPSIFIVDGNAAVRTSLSSLIRSAGWWPRAVGSAEEFLAAPRMVGANCLITELQLPGLNGLELQERVRDRADTPVIFLSSSANIQTTVQAMKAGAFEFLQKPLIGEVLLCAVRGAIERSRMALRCQAQARTLHHRYESLSPREREVMNLVVSGRLNKQVGGALGISEITVKVHRGSLMRKMQAGSFAELVGMALNLSRPTASWIFS